MSLAIIYSRASAGIAAPLVTVETHISPGMAGFYIVGLPEAEVKESRDRVRSALLNANFDFPGRRITVNLAPADLPKEGGRFDLPIALGILVATNQLPAEKLADYEFTGELALSGELRLSRGVLPMTLAAYQSKRTLVVPEANANEAAMIPYAEVLYAKHLLDVCAHMRGETKLSRCKAAVYERPPAVLDMKDVSGQPQAKRALQIAAAGRHSLLFVGPPGTGKTMLATRMPSILPELTQQEAIEVAAIASVSRSGFEPALWQRIPFRAPHHSSSCVALVGGGRSPRPGEISLAHRGVLFLDELPEFGRHALESLREPMEAGIVTISRAAMQTVFPAAFQLVAAMNPCPCGYAGCANEICQCSPEQIKRYVAKISGPLLDRIDMQVEVARLPPEWLLRVNHQSETPSAVIQQQIVKTRERQFSRQGKANAELTVSEINRFCELPLDAKNLLSVAMNKFNFSARVYHRILKVSRTIADMAESNPIESAHIAEALGCRRLDKLRLNP